MNESLALTRYLYNKTRVFELLLEAMDENQYDESLFWGYELYYSWLEIETIDYLITLAESKLPGYKRFHRFLSKKKAEWLSKEIHEKPHNIIATIIKNILIRDPILTECDAQIYVIISINDIESYETKIIYPIYKTLPLLCKYWLTIPENPPVVSEEQRSSLRDFCDHWLFYASKIPLWEHRILQYKGTIDKETRQVIFENDDLMEEFFEKYGYEPDEQPIEIQRRLLGI